MTAEELERALARIGRMAGSARERAAGLLGDVAQMRELMQDLTTSVRNGVAPPSETEDKAARQGTTEAENAQVEVVFK